MDELKPCPFCGGEAEVQLGKAGQASAFCDLFKVECLKCGVSQADWDAVRAEVIDAWNTRPPVTDEMVERAVLAILKAQRDLGADPLSWDDATDAQKSGCKTVMRAAITAALGG